METKICSKCGEKKECSEFYKNKRLKDGLEGICKNCRNSQALQWRHENRERVASKTKEYRERNKEKIREKGKEYYREKGKEYHERYTKRERHRRKEILKILKMYIYPDCRSYAERIRDNVKKWNSQNKDKIKQGMRSRAQKERLEIKDRYVIKLCGRQLEMSSKGIRSNPELIQLKRLEIALKRKRKEITKK